MSFMSVAYLIIGYRYHPLDYITMSMSTVYVYCLSILSLYIVYIYCLGVLTIFILSMYNVYVFCLCILSIGLLSLPSSYKTQNIDWLSYYCIAYDCSQPKHQLHK